MALSQLPPTLGPSFSVSAARELDVTDKRLRMHDLEPPFHGVRLIRSNGEAQEVDHFQRLRDRELELIRALGTRLLPGQFFCHRSAAILWDAPVPYRTRPDLHLGVVKPRRSPRLRGVTGHALTASRVEVREALGLPVTSPALTFATMGHLSLTQLVALGDYLVRQHRAGYGRRDVGKPPIATRAELHDMVERGRWRGINSLKQAVRLVREDSWSPMESLVRVLIVLAGLPEPELNGDVYDDFGHFLGCVDLLYRDLKIAIEYHGEQHSDTYAKDIERAELLRSHDWEVVLVTKILADQPRLLVSRIESKLRKRGWRG